MKTCVKCSRELEDDFVVCPICQTKVLEMPNWEFCIRDIERGIKNYSTFSDPFFERLQSICDERVGMYEPQGFYFVEFVLKSMADDDMSAEEYYEVLCSFLNTLHYCLEEINEEVHGGMF